MDKIDLDELERVADGYEARKKAIIKSGIRRDQAYIATFAEGDSVKAFEALRPLLCRNVHRCGRNLWSSMNRT